MGTRLGRGKALPTDLGGPCAGETLKSTGAIVAEVYTWSQGGNSMRAAELIPHIEREHGFLPSDLCEPLRRPLDGRLVQVDLLLEPA